MAALDSGWLKKLESFGNLLQNNQWRAWSQIVFK
jgi:hypothetical protein